MQASEAAGRAAGEARRLGRVLQAEIPRVGPLRGEHVFLGAVVVAQWVAIAALAAATTHNGWFWHQGGDQTYFWSYAWLFGQGLLPGAEIGYLWSLVEAPLTLVWGSSYLDALPVIVIVQVAVLAPAGVLAVYGLVHRLLGRAAARVAVLGWIVVPFAVIPLFVERYHERYIDLFLPQAHGLTGMGDYPSMILLLVAAYLVFRTVDERGWELAALAGLVTGLAIGLKPANALAVAAPFAALLLARRLRETAAFAAALAPVVLALAVWKHRGLGEIPLFALPGTRLAAAGAIPVPDLVALNLDKYVDLDWEQLRRNLDGFREYFWSRRLVEFLPLAGAVGALRLSVPKAAYLVLWLFPFVVVKGTSEVASVESASFLRLVMPAWPAYFALTVCIVALVPVLGGRLRRAPVPAAPRPSWLRPVLATAAVLLAAVPLVLVAALPQDDPSRTLDLRDRNVHVPEDAAFEARARRVPGGIEVEWDAQGAGASAVSYVVVRLPADGSERPGILCDERPGGVDDCYLQMPAVGTTTETRLVDRVGPGRFTYRVLQTVSYRGLEELGDPLVVSAPVTAG